MKTYGQNKCLLYTQENATKPVITWVIQYFLCLFWAQPAALSRYAGRRICFFSISLSDIHKAVSFPPKSPIIMAALLLLLRKWKQSVFVRELGKKSGIENLSVARLQHDEVWTQSDSALNYGKQWLCRMKVPSQPTAARSTCLKEFQ